ncbi:MAG: efflux RND transporter periplasmic adaptor subunit [Immundisolibacteraceae bacterium]|nr:efflux RND transporter periplasmic adaptor subunit [Immundisolibacteraceae bacterium]
MSRQKIHVISRIIFSALLLQCPAIVNAAGGDGNQPPIPVKAVAVGSSGGQSIFHTAGQLTVKTQALSFKIPGRLIDILVEEGDLVVAGQILARLEDIDALDRARDSQATLDLAQSHFRRIDALYADQKASEDDHQSAQTALEQARVADNQAQVNLQRCRLHAPQAGVIGVKYFEHPGTVAAGTPIYALQRADRPWLVEIDNLTDRQILSVNEGAQVQVEFSPYPGEVFPGLISMVGQEADRADGLYRLEVTIATERPLKPGMLAKVVLFTNVENQGSVVPLAALRNLRGSAGELYVPSGDNRRAKKINVTVIDVIDGFAILAENLSTPDVITFGRNLSDGSRIEIVQ